MYTVRLKGRSIGSRSRMDRFIEGSSVVRIGMISGNEPYVVPVNFVYFNGAVWFHCSPSGRKAEALQMGERVCLEFDEQHGIDVPGADTFYTSVIAWGRSRVIEERPVKRQVLEMLVEKYLETSREITDTMLDRTCIVAVDIREITGKENRP